MCARAGCPDTQAPVCDVNGVTQQNLCMAQAAGVAVACNGACPCTSEQLKCVR